MAVARSQTGTLPDTPPAAKAAPPLWRAPLIGALLIPLSTYWGNYAYVVTQALLWGQTSLLRGPVFCLFLLTLGNLLLRKGGKRAGLTASEMLIIYSMLAVSVCVSGYGMMQFLVNILPSGPYNQTPANHYDRFLHYVPTYLVPHDPAVINDFYRGGTTLYRADILRDWAVPVLVWSLFLFAMCWVTLCLSALVRKQWTDEEKLSFPLVYLPLEMAQGGAGHTPFYANRLMWTGFAIAGLLESINYLNYFYPSLPSVPIKPSVPAFQIDALLASAPPWDKVGSLRLAFYPFAIGIGYLLSLEVSFSCWFFFLLTRMENVLSAAWGLNSGAHGGTAQWPFIPEQGVGSFLALALVLLWRARKPLGNALRAGWDKAVAADTDDPGSPLSPRAALWGGLVGIVLLTAFLSVIGLPVWASIAFWVVYFLFLLVVTRIVVEAGAGWVWGPYSAPVHAVLIDAVGTAPLGDRGLTQFAYLNWFEQEFRDSPMPQQLMAMKMGVDTQTPRRQLLWALLIAAAISGVVAFWAFLHMYYEFGAASAKVRPVLQGIGSNNLKMVDNWLKNPKAPDTAALGGMAGGAIIVVALATLRQTFTWWPLHPIGYALAGTASMEYMWCPFLVAWALKALTLRYGGVKAYRQALPFFLGLILGDYAVPTLWGLWGTFQHTQVYLAFPH